MKKIYSFILLISIATLAFGQEKEMEISAEIQRVTIYNSSAELTYHKVVALPPGKSTLIFTDLTPFIVDNTINVSASKQDVDIITITERINYVRERKAQNDKINSLLDSINRAESELGLLRCKTEALSMEKGLLFKNESIGGVAEGVAVAEIEKASAFFSKRYYELSTELYKLTLRDKMLQHNLSKYQYQIKELSSNTSKPSSEIQVTVINPTAKNVEFTFKFLTSKAGWAPAYDCKYQGAEKPINFVFRANVFNASGVNWDNIDIKLSTASPTAGFNTPSIATKKIEEKGKSVNDGGEVKFREIEVSNAIAEYDIKHKYSIPSDSKPYLVDVNTFEMNAQYYYLVIPQVDPNGFLMAKIPDWNKYNLISGTTNIYNRGSFMGKTFLNTNVENDTLNLYLGKDNNIQSSKKEVNSSNQHTIIGNYQVDKSAITISVKNNSSEKLNIQLLDQVPEFVDNEKIKFNMQGAEEAVYIKETGLLTWNFNLSQNENKTIDYKYEIKTPKNTPGYVMQRKRMRVILCPSF